MKHLPLLTVAGWAMMSVQATAQESYPKLSGEIIVEIENDFTFDSDDPDAELNDTFTTTEAGLTLQFSEIFSLNTTVLLEPVSDPEPDEDRFFEDHGLFAEELFAQADFGAFSIVAGKFNPSFGFAWDLAPGVFGVDFAEDGYELTERLGAAVSIPFQIGASDVALTVSAFAADRTFLSDSLFSERGNVDEADGGVSNTDSPESFVVALTGDYQDASYNLGFRRQEEGSDGITDEYGFVAGVVTPLGANTGIEMIAEAAYFPDYDGGREEAIIGTTGLSAPVGPLTLSGVYAFSDISGASTDHLATASVDYEIFEGFTASLAYRYSREGGDDNNAIGALFVYERGF